MKEKETLKIHSSSFQDVIKQFEKLNELHKRKVFEIKFIPGHITEIYGFNKVSKQTEIVVRAVLNHETSTYDVEAIKGLLTNFKQVNL